MMELFPEISLKLLGGWLLAIIYLIVNLGIPFSKKGTLQRLLRPAKKQITIHDKIFDWITRLSWWGTILLPIIFPIKVGSIFFNIGIILFSTGMIFTAISLWNYVTTPLNQPIVNGLYRFSRNPIYASYNIVGYGIGFLTGSWFLMILHTVNIITCHFMVLDEEKYCLEKYGNDYNNYLKKVPRYYLGKF